MEPLHFAVIGVAKGGTTTLFRHLQRLPELYVPARKELPYFFGRREDFDRYYRDAADYHGRFFAEMPPARLPGIVTPQYMYGAPTDGPLDRDLAAAAREIPLRLHAYAPEIKLIAVLRDPVARAISHHRMNVLRRKDSRTLDDAIETLLHEQELARARRAPNELNLYVTAGEYGRILDGYLDVFDRDQLLITFTDELERDPVGVLARICTFLGVEAPDELPAERANVGGTRRRFERLDFYDWHRATAELPSLRRAWNLLPVRSRMATARRFESLAYAFAEWNRVRDPHAAATTAPSLRTRTRLAAHYLPDDGRLGEILGRPAPWSASSR